MAKRVDRRRRVELTSRRIAGGPVADACYFPLRTPSRPAQSPAQITDRCDLRCAHCFVSATAQGADMCLDDLRGAVPKLLDMQAATVTLTGGEPLIHPDLEGVLVLLREAGMEVTICTNGVSLTDRLIKAAQGLGRVKFNVSLDGLTKDSHGKFRGNKESFDKTLSNTRRIAEAGLLKGILSTPNSLARADEYAALFHLAHELGAEYLLMNPLSSFGRGINSSRRLRADTKTMSSIQERITESRSSGDPEAVFIRFPNESKPLSNCVAGDLFYVFSNGDVTVCPYLVFATENPHSQYDRSDFIVGNLFSDEDIAARLETYRFTERYPMGNNDTCHGCGQSSVCGKGCPAAVVAAGGRIGELDAEVCPVTGVS